MMDILIPVLLVVAMGFIFAVILTIASKDILRTCG